MNAKKDLREQIATFESLSAQLEGTPEERAELLAIAGQFSNQYITDLPDLKSYADSPVDVERIRIGEKTRTTAQLLEIFNDEVLTPGIRAASGGHLGYIPGGGIYAGAIGDLLAAVSNEYVGVKNASPGGVAIENALIDWLKSVFNFPQQAVGNLTSGGSIANLIALTAARDKYGIKNEKVLKGVIYLSEQVHHCIRKSLRIIGLEDVIVRNVKLDDAFKIDVDELKALVKADQQAGLQPFLVVASAGTTDVGAIDPLDKIATVAKENNLWFHVDAAYGGFFILTSKKDAFKGIEKADSFVVDPHKGMFLPYGIGAVLVKDAQAVLHSNLYLANYMQDMHTDDLVHDPANVSPELSKHFRSMRMWLPLQLYGTEPFIACLEEKLLLTRFIRERLVELGFMVGPEPDLSVSYFWYPSGGDENAFNKLLLKYMHEDGSVFFSSTLLQNKFVIRIAILSFRTKLTTVEQALDMIERCLERAKTS